MVYTPKPTVHEVVYWIPLCGSMVKINTDATLNSDNSKVSFGVVIRRATGEVVLPAGLTIHKCVDVEFTELQAVRYGVSPCCAVWITNVIMEFTIC